MSTTIRRTITPLTDRQLEIYSYIFNQTMANGYQPSIRDIMASMGVASANAVTSQLKALCRKGWIGPSDGCSRCLSFHLRPDGRPFQGFVCREETP